MTILVVCTYMGYKFEKYDKTNDRQGNEHDPLG